MFGFGVGVLHEYGIGILAGFVYPFMQRGVAVETASGEKRNAWLVGDAGDGVELVDG